MAFVLVIAFSLVDWFVTVGLGCSDVSEQLSSESAFSTYIAGVENCRHFAPLLAFAKIFVQLQTNNVKRRAKVPEHMARVSAAPYIVHRVVYMGSVLINEETEWVDNHEEFKALMVCGTVT